jgi:hypothetical protein
MNNQNKVFLIDSGIIILKIKDQNQQGHIKIVFNLNPKKIKNNGSILTNHSIKTMMTIIKINLFIKKNQ